MSIKATMVRNMKSASSMVSSPVREMDHSTFWIATLGMPAPPFRHSRLQDAYLAVRLVRWICRRSPSVKRRHVLFLACSC